MTIQPYSSIGAPSGEASSPESIQNFPSELLYQLFRHLTDGNRLGAAKQLCVLRSVCKAWNFIVEQELAKDHWKRCAQIPWLRTPINQIDALCHPNTTWSSRFARLTLHLRNKKAPIPENVPCLGLHYFCYIQIQQDAVLVTIWGKIRQQMNFAEDLAPETAQEIRKWLNDETNSVHIDLITKLDLSDLALPLLPPEISKFRKLRKLDLSSNQLRELPPEISELSGLRKLDLSRNQLKELPSEIGELNELQRLNINHNQLSKLPPEIGKLSKLWELRLAENQLRELPFGIGALGTLSWLDLSGNQFTHLPSGISELGKFGKLQHLDFSNNRLTHLPPEIDKLRRLGLTCVLHSNLLLFRLNQHLLDHSPRDSNLRVFYPHIKTVLSQYLACATYPCQAPLAKLCQAIHRGEGSETLRARFKELSKEMQGKILKHIPLDPSQSSSSNQPGGDYLADRVVFVKALIIALQEKFQDLTEPEKRSVYEMVAFLDREPASIASRGMLIADDNIIRFIEAIEWVTRYNQ